MPALYYELELGPDGALVATRAAAAPAQMPPDADLLLTRLRGAFDRARLRVADGPAKTAFANYVLAVGRLGLHEGNLQTAAAQLEGLDEANGHVHYYAVSMDDAEDIHLSAPPWATRPDPEEVSVLWKAIDQAANKVKRLVQDKGKRAQYLRMLLSYARRGLQEGDIKSARDALDQFKQQFVDAEGPASRAHYVRNTLLTAAGILSVLIVAMLVYVLVAWRWPVAIVFDQRIVPTVLAVGFGVCLGVSFFAFVRNLNLTFDQLGSFDPANLSAVLRFALVGIIAVILCILLSAGPIKLEIAGLQFEQYLDNPLTAIILGMVCGYSDAAITRTLTGVLDRK